MKWECRDSDIELLVKELEVHSIDLSDLIENYPDFIKNLLYGLHAPFHENRGPEWGMFFNENIPTDSVAVLETYKSVFCDGQTSFGFKKLHESLIQTILFPHLLVDEEILSLCDTSLKAAIIRTPEVLKIYTNGEIYVCENRSWRILGSVRNAISKVKNHYNLIDVTLFSQIIRFAYYELSLNKIGGIIVYWLDRSYKLEKSKIADPFELKFDDSGHKKILKHYMRFNDGAIVLLKNGRVLGGNVHLSYSNNSRDLIPPNSGTRHTSSQRFSFDHPKAIVITISSDGPVSLYSDGYNIATLDPLDNFRGPDLLNTAESVNKGFDKEIIVQCANCGKTHKIMVLEDETENVQKTATCRVCKDTLSSYLCSEINNQLIKVIG